MTPSEAWALFFAAVAGAHPPIDAIGARWQAEHVDMMVEEWAKRFAPEWLEARKAKS